MHIPFNKGIIENKTKRIVVLFLITIFPILFVLSMYWLSKENYSIFLKVGSEDNLIEWGQVVFFGASGVIAFILALKFRKISKVMFVIFLVLSLGLIFIAGEEISWGQRIFRIEGSEIFDGDTEVPFLKNNVQSETNLHNFDVIHSRIGYVYLTIGAYGCFGWFLACIFDKIFKVKKTVRRYVPFFVIPPYLFLYFFALATNLIPRVTVRGVLPQVYEMGEFLFSLGVFIFILLSYIYFKRKFEAGMNEKIDIKEKYEK